MSKQDSILLILNRIKKGCLLYIKYYGTLEEHDQAKYKSKAEEVNKLLQLVNQIIRNANDGISLKQIQRIIILKKEVEDILPNNFFELPTLEELSPTNIINGVKSRIKEVKHVMFAPLVSGGNVITNITTETMDSISHASREIAINRMSNIEINPKTGEVTIDSTQDAVVHYYTGGGKTVTLGKNTVRLIKQSKSMNHYRNRIEKGLTSNPAEGKGLKVDMTMEDTRTFHLGRMAMKYSTICKGKQCTTTYIVDDAGFVDPNSISGYSSREDNKDDNKGPNNELGGDPYDYRAVKWSETYLNPGYKVDKNGRPMPLKK